MRASAGFNMCGRETRRVADLRLATPADHERPPLDDVGQANRGWRKRAATLEPHAVKARHRSTGWCMALA